MWMLCFFQITIKCVTIKIKYVYLGNKILIKTGNHFIPEMSFLPQNAIKHNTYCILRLICHTNALTLEVCETSHWI